MIHVALFRPEIPQNTGAIARLCAATQVPLHIIGRPLFEISDRSVKRAGLDYWPWVPLHQHEDWAGLSSHMPPSGKIYYLTTKATKLYTEIVYRPGDCLAFGQETRGLPKEILEAHPENCVTIPMTCPHVRSLNLSQSVAITVYEALRQLRAAAG